MKTRQIIIKFLVVFSIFFSLVNISETYAYWGDVVESKEYETTSIFNIGSWEEVLYDTWTSNVVYQKGDIVYHEGSYYEAQRRIKNHTPNSKWFSHFFWKEITV